METTCLSSKGQIVIPQGIREAYQWKPGLKFAIIETDRGILLIPINSFPQTSINEVLGCTHYRGRKKSLKQMQEGIAKGARKQK